MKHADMAMYVAKAASSLAVIDASPAPLLEAEPMKPEYHRGVRGVACVPLELM
jgi:hypothetical protein